MEAVSFYVADF